MKTSETFEILKLRHTCPNSAVILSVFVSLIEAVCSDPAYYLPIICLLVA